MRHLPSGSLADRANPHNRDVWRVIKDIPKDDLVWRLLTAGISATAGSELGTNRDGEKTFLHQALWIGDNFGQRGLGGLRMGEWAFNMLLALPGVFALDPADVLELTADANDFLDEVLSQAVDNNPLLYPVTTPPLDWTQVNKGGPPAEHWARVSLIGDNHPAIMGAVRKAIGTGQMQPVLDAVNSLQRVPYRINEHVYEFILRDGEPPGPDDDRPPVWQEQKIQRRNGSRLPLHCRRSTKIWCLPIPCLQRLGASTCRLTWIFAGALMPSRISVFIARIVCAPCSSSLMVSRLARTG